MVFTQAVKLLAVIFAIACTAPSFAANPDSYHGGMNGGSSGASSAGNSGSTSGFNDNGMGRDTRSETSMGYLLSTYGADTANWPCDSTTSVGVPASQVNVGDAPAHHSSHRAGQYMRDRK